MGLMKWLVIAVVGFVLYKLLGNYMRKRSENKGKSDNTGKKPTPEGRDMVKDPVCGAFVDMAGSISVRDGETTSHFCSYECRDAFLDQLRGAGREIPEKRDDTSL